MTLEELKLGFDRVAAAQACRNLAGAISYYETATRSKDIVSLWAERDDDVLFMPWGAYYGIDGVRDCYLKDIGDRDDPGMQDSPKMKGVMNIRETDTCVVEVAGDNQTARGCWMSPGCNTAVRQSTGRPQAEWEWRKICADFIHEGDTWKIWKLHIYPLVTASYETCWTEYKDPLIKQYEFPHAKPLPRENWHLAKDTVYPNDQPIVPLPYQTYPDLPEFDKMGEKNDTGQIDSQVSSRQVGIKVSDGQGNVTPQGGRAGTEGSTDQADSKILAELEHRLKKLQAQEACRNLVGRYLFAHPAFDNIPFVDSWAKREDDALEMPWGTYNGYEGVRNCYLRDHGDRTFKETYDTLGGALFLHEADTEVLEVAEDCKTAQGVWISMGHETFVMNEKSRDTGDAPGTWEAEWAWSKYAFDFIFEDGLWKIWHMRLYPLFKAPFGKSWVEEEQPKPEDWKFEDIDSRPQVPWWTYGPDKIYPPDEPEPPLPYGSFDELGKGAGK